MADAEHSVEACLGRTKVKCLEVGRKGHILLYPSVQITLYKGEIYQEGTIV